MEQTKQDNNVLNNDKSKFDENSSNLPLFVQNETNALEERDTTVATTDETTTTTETITETTAQETTAPSAYELEKAEIKKLREKATKRKKLPFLFIFFVAYGIYFTLTTFLFYTSAVFVPMKVVGASMYPTLNYQGGALGASEKNDVVFLWRTHELNYGDIVVFDATSLTGDDSYYIKRVIAKAGDTICFKRVSDITQYSATIYKAEYAVYLNGEKLDEPYIYTNILFTVGPSPENIDGITGSGVTETFKQIIREETLTVPENCIFVMGDNRNNSTDSREFGFVPLDCVVGKVKIQAPYGTNLIYAIFYSIKKDYLF